MGAQSADVAEWSNAAPAKELAGSNRSGGPNPPSALTNLEEKVYTDNRKESIMAEAVFIKVRLYSYGKSGAGSYSCYGSGRIGVTENRNCQSPG